jgi:hypothetical protein
MVLYAWAALHVSICSIFSYCRSTLHPSHILAALGEGWDLAFSAFDSSCMAVLWPATNQGTCPWKVLHVNLVNAICTARLWQCL